MMKAYLVFIFISCAAAEYCPKTIKGMPDFDINKFTGTWYRIKYGGTILGGKCITLTFSINKNGTISVVRNAIAYKTGKPFTIKGWSENENAKLSFAFPSFNVKTCSWIVDTDYVSFAVIWGWEKGKEKAWLLTREQHPDEKILNKALTEFDNYGFNHYLFRDKDQLDFPKDSEGKAPYE